MSTPLIAHWPAGIPWHLRGSFVRQMGFLPDFMPTFIELAQTQYPVERAGVRVHPLAGKSLLPLLQGEQTPVHQEPVYWEHEGNRAMRDGKWKLVWSVKGPWELYDMDADRTEMHDLSSKEPERLRNMIGGWESWAKSVGVSFPEPINYYKAYKQSQGNQ